MTLTRLRVRVLAACTVAAVAISTATEAGQSLPGVVPDALSIESIEAMSRRLSAVTNGNEPAIVASDVFVAYEARLARMRGLETYRHVLVETFPTVAGRARLRVLFAALIADVEHRLGDELLAAESAAIAAIAARSGLAGDDLPVLLVELDRAAERADRLPTIRPDTRGTLATHLLGRCAFDPSSGLVRENLPEAEALARFERLLSTTTAELHDRWDAARTAELVRLRSVAATVVAEDTGASPEEIDRVHAGGKARLARARAAALAREETFLAFESEWSGEVVRHLEDPRLRACLGDYEELRWGGQFSFGRSPAMRALRSIIEHWERDGRAPSSIALLSDDERDLRRDAVELASACRAEAIAIARRRVEAPDEDWSADAAFIRDVARRYQRLYERARATLERAVLIARDETGETPRDELAVVAPLPQQCPGFSSFMRPLGTRDAIDAALAGED